MAFGGWGITVAIDSFYLGDSGEIFVKRVNKSPMPFVIPYSVALVDTTSSVLITTGIRDKQILECYPYLEYQTVH